MTDSTHTKWEQLKIYKSTPAIYKTHCEKKKIVNDRVAKFNACHNSAKANMTLAKTNPNITGNILDHADLT